MRLGLILGEAFQGLRRNTAMVVSVVLVTFISLTFVGVAILLQQQINSMKGYWYDRAQVAVAFCSAFDQTGNCVQAAATDEEVAAVQAKLAEDSIARYIERTEYDPPATVLAQTKEYYADTSIGSLLTEDFVGGILHVTLYDPSNADIVVEAVSGFAGVLSVDDQRKYLEPIFGILNAAIGGRDRRRGAHARRRGAPHRDDHPALGVLPKTRARHHAPRRRIEPAHRDAVRARGRVRPRSSARSSRAPRSSSSCSSSSRASSARPSAAAVCSSASATRSSSRRSSS